MALDERGQERAWNRRDKKYYREREDTASITEERLLKDEHIEFILNCYKSGGFTNFPDSNQIDIQSTFAGLNCAVLLQIPNFKSLLKEVNPVLNKNLLGIQCDSRVIPVKNMPDLYRFSNLLRTLNWNPDEQEKHSIIRTITHLFTVSDLRRVYEKTAIEYNCCINPDNELSVKAISDNWKPEIGFFRWVRDRPVPVSDAWYNAVALSHMIKYTLPNDMKNSILQALDKYRSVDGYRTHPAHHPNVWSLYDLALTNYMMRGVESEDKIIAIKRYLLRCQSISGGFYSGVHGDHPTILKSSCALFLYELMSGDHQKHLDLCSGAVVNQRL